MDFMLSRATRVTAQWASAPVQHAVARFWRDMEMTLSTTGFVPDNRLMICLAPALPPESYTLDVTENQLTLCAADDLGAVYGLLDISRHYLGVAPFWFWNQQQFEPKPFATVPEGRITGPAAAVGLRGWDLSDAPWLSAWADATENGWEMIFESLLRYRGNMVRTTNRRTLPPPWACALYRTRRPRWGLPHSRLRRKTRKNAIKSGRILSALSKPARASGRWALTGWGVIPMAQPALRRCKSNGSC